MNFAFSVRGWDGIDDLQNMFGISLHMSYLRAPKKISTSVFIGTVFGDQRYTPKRSIFSEPFRYLFVSVGILDLRTGKLFIGIPFFFY